MSFAGAQDLVIDPFPVAEPDQNLLQAAPQPKPDPIMETQRIDYPPHIADARMDVTAIIPSGYGSMPEPVPSASAPVIFWEAAAGESLQHHLKTWAEREGVELIWALAGDYRVAEPLRFRGNFEGAVVSILEQYRPYANRPVADLHINQVDGARTLIIRNMF